MSVQRTLEQERANRAWEYVKAVDEERPREFKEDYRGLALKLPAYILTNGLGQTLAFLKAKGESKPDKPQEVIYQHISKWVSGRIGLGADADLLEGIITGDSRTYRWATVEALAFCGWLQRFAQAKLPKEER
jgi:CRISPR-associated protein Cmr5